MNANEWSVLHQKCDLINELYERIGKCDKEVERLRAALERIADWHEGDVDTCYTMAVTAREALK